MDHRPRPVIFLQISSRSVKRTKPAKKVVQTIAMAAPIPIPPATSSAATVFLTFFLLTITTPDHPPSSPLAMAESKHTHPNPRLHQAYVALHAWKRVIYSDPTNLTSDWAGPDVCAYTGVFCADQDHEQVVAGIDLNHGDIAGFLPDELGLLSDLALLHLNSNRFCGVLPLSLSNLTLLHELDLSNNRFVGGFPSVVLSLPSLRYLDLRFNEFEGALPPELFRRGLDAIFVNNNRLASVILASVASATAASVVVFANNNLGGCLPEGIGKLAESLEELLLINTNLSGCLPPEVGLLHKLKVLDVSSNQLVGTIPYSLAGLSQVEQLNLAHNKMSGDIPAGVCSLPRLQNFTVSYNFFCEEDGLCRNLTSFDDRRNCLPERPAQRGKEACDAALRHLVDCLDYRCGVDNGGDIGGGGGGQTMVGIGSPSSAPYPSPFLGPGSAQSPSPSIHF